MKMAFFGSSLVSAYWNGAATYYRGIIRALAKAGHEITFYEPDIYDRQAHRDIEDPPYAKVRVYSAEDEQTVLGALKEAEDADLMIKTSGVGAFDEFLEAQVLELRQPGQRVVFWDVDAPATLERVGADKADPFRRLIPEYDAILTYGGGPPVVQAYEELGARGCYPIYNALDPTTHFRVEPDERFSAQLGFVGNRLPDREERVEEFFFKPARELSDHHFLLAGSGWGDKERPENLEYMGHLYSRDHNRFNSSCSAILNINRASMARFGYSPPTRVFEAAGAAACLITDAWEGIEEFLTPGEEVLVVKNGDDVVSLLKSTSEERRREIGETARRRVLSEHTYEDRARDMEAVLERLFGSPSVGVDQSMGGGR